MSATCRSFAAALLAILSAVPALASEVTLHTRPIVATAHGSAQDYLDDWNAALKANPVAPAGFGDVVISTFHNVENQTAMAGGARTGISEFYNVDFDVPRAAGGGQWQFRFTTDFGLGGAVFLDGKPVAYNPANLDGSIWFEFSRHMTPGTHNIQIYGQEDCCDGYSDGQFRAPGGPPLVGRDVGNFAFTDGYNLK